MQSKSGRGVSGRGVSRQGGCLDTWCTEASEHLCNKIGGDIGTPHTYSTQAYKLQPQKN